MVVFLFWERVSKIVCIKKKIFFFSLVCETKVYFCLYVNWHNSWAVVYWVCVCAYLVETFFKCSFLVSISLKSSKYSFELFFSRLYSLTPLDVYLFYFIFFLGFWVPNQWIWISWCCFFFIFCLLDECVCECVFVWFCMCVQFTLYLICF